MLISFNATPRSNIAGEIQYEKQFPLYVPDLKENLVGHKAMCKQGFSFNIAANGTPTLTRDGTNVCQLVKMGDFDHYPR